MLSSRTVQKKESPRTRGNYNPSDLYLREPKTIAR